MSLYSNMKMSNHCTNLEVDASQVASAEELHLVLVFVERVVVDRRVLSRVPVEHELAVVEASRFLLLLLAAQVPRLRGKQSQT